MSKEKAAPGGQTGNGKGDQMIMSEVLRPCRQSTTNDGRMQVSGYLLEGAENAVSMKMLMRITGSTDRVIRDQIHQERRQGVPILSDMRTGYYLPRSDAERERWLRSMFHRAPEILRAAQAVERGPSDG